MADGSPETVFQTEVESAQLEAFSHAWCTTMLDPLPNASVSEALGLTSETIMMCYAVELHLKMDD